MVLRANDYRQAIPAARLRRAVEERYAAQIESQQERRAKLRDVDPIDWMQEHFYIPSTEKTIELFPWQKGILRLALKRNEAGRFIWTTVLYGTIKKSGKSTIAGAVARWTAETQTRFGEIYAVGNDFGQAKDRAFKEAKISIELSPGYLMGRQVLPGRWDVKQTYMYCHLTGSRIEPLSMDAKGAAGGHPALSIWCVTGETDVLCRDGWKRADELTLDDEVAALVPETGKMRWERPRAVNVTPYSGKMVRFRHRRAEFTVTPNHRVWGRFVTHSRETAKAEDRGWWFEEAKDAARFAAGWFKGDADWEPENYFATAAARFLGYYMAEGHVDKNNVVISQSRAQNPETYEAIRQTFVDVGLKPRCYPTRISVADKHAADELRPLGKSWEKFIPPHLKNGPVEALRAFFDAYIEGDGWRTHGDAFQCETTSKLLADDLMEIALKIGYHPRLMGSRLRKPGVQPNGSGKPLTARHVIYRLSFSKGAIYWERTYNGKKGGTWEEIDYEGTVACPSLEHGVFYIRSNGKCCWTGNTELWGFEHEYARRMWDEMTRDPTQPDSVRWVETYAGYDGESMLLYGLYESVTKNGRQLTNEEFARSASRDVDGERYEDMLTAFVETDGDPAAMVPIYYNEPGGIFGYWDDGLAARRFPWQDEQYYREEEATLPALAYQRLHLNLWVGAESDFVPIQLWDECFDPDLPDVAPDVWVNADSTPAAPGTGIRRRGEPMVLAVDAASSGDCFAVVGVTRHPLDHSRPAVRKYKVWTPDDFPDKRINFETAEAFLREVCRLYHVVQIAYDPYQLEDMMQRLRRDRVAACKEFNQGTARLEADRGLFDRIMQGTMAHREDPAAPGALRQHIINSNAHVQKNEDSKMRIIKKAEKRKIDLAVAMSMGISRCMFLNLPVWKPLAS